MKPRWLGPLCAAFAAVLPGCSSMLLPSTPAPVYLRLAYESPSVSCTKPFDRGLTVFDFSEAAPYDGTRLVALSGNHEVELSSAYRWVARPGSMVAGMLVRDLSESSLFPRVSGGTSPSPPPLELTGRILDFAWQKSKGRGQAVLDVLVSVVDREQPEKVLLSKDYRFTGLLVDGSSASVFGRQMSGLVRRMSAALEKDLCRVRAREPGSH